MADALRGLLRVAFDLAHVYSGVRVVKPGTDQVFTVTRQWEKSWMTAPAATYTDSKGKPVLLKAVLDEGTPGVLASRGVSYDDDGWLIPTDDLYSATHSLMQLFVNAMRQYGSKDDPHWGLVNAVLAMHAMTGTLAYVDDSEETAESESDDNKEGSKDGTDAE